MIPSECRLLGIPLPHGSIPTAIDIMFPLSLYGVLAIAVNPQRKGYFRRGLETPAPEERLDSVGIGHSASDRLLLFADVQGRTTDMMTFALPCYDQLALDLVIRGSMLSQDWVSTASGPDSGSFIEEAGFERRDRAHRLHDPFRCAKGATSAIQTLLQSAQKVTEVDILSIDLAGRYLVYVAVSCEEVWSSAAHSWTISSFHSMIILSFAWLC